jgi:hypothetical protein
LSTEYLKSRPPTTPALKLLVLIRAFETVQKKWYDQRLLNQQKLKKQLAYISKQPIETWSTLFPQDNSLNVLSFIHLSSLQNDTFQDPSRFLSQSLREHTQNRTHLIDSTNLMKSVNLSPIKNNHLQNSLLDQKTSFLDSENFIPSTNMIHSVEYPPETKLLLRKCLYNWYRFAINHKTQRLNMVDDWIKAANHWKTNALTTLLSKWRSKTQLHKVANHILIV